MATLLQQSENLKKLNESVIERQIFKALKEAEVAVLQANKEQLSRGENAEKKIVGEYAIRTEEYADAKGTFTNVPKDAGMPYNFNWTGEFLKGFTLSVSTTEARINSTGVGSGGKREFLTSENLFGLNDENLKKIIQSEILPFIHSFARKTLNI